MENLGKNLILFAIAAGVGAYSYKLYSERNDGRIQNPDDFDDDMMQRQIADKVRELEQAELEDRYSVTSNRLARLNPYPDKLGDRY